MDVDSDWVTFIIACLFVFFILCLSIILRKNCSKYFCQECTHGTNELPDEQQQHHHRRIRPRSRERELEQLRIEQLQIHQQLHQIYQAAQHHQHQLQCQRCHRLQLQDHHHHPHHDVIAQPLHPDCDVIIPPPPEYVDFALPAYDELFPNLETVHKPEGEVETTTTTGTPPSSTITTSTPAPTSSTLQQQTSTVMIVGQTSHNLN